MSSLDALASRLRRLRQRHELTQEEFAESIGLNYKFYQQIEAGRKKQIWLETVERLATGFGLEPWQLLAPDEPAHSTILNRSNSEDPVEQKAVAEAASPYRAKTAKKKKLPKPARKTAR